ncbi:AAA family ATPase, partial [Vibrio antiquarius]|uniref:AAA family ATPase n=1 Tax=Vibrio antiquarius (strain Ex25) TaxID=150340 RepID=UPI002657EA2D
MDNYIRRVRVSGLFEQQNNLIVDFEKDLNCIYGYNGTGKTVLIDLIVNALTVNLGPLRRAPFNSLTILTSSKKQPEKFLTVTNSYDDITYTFHRDLTTKEKSIRSNFTRTYRVSKDIQYVIATTRHPHGERTVFSKEKTTAPAAIIRSIISSFISISYVPLLRVNHTSIKSNDVEERVSSKHLSSIQEEFSKQYASAQSLITRKLEKLSSEILQKLLLSKEDVTSSNIDLDQRIIDKHLSDKDYEKTQEKLAVQIRELGLDIPVYQITEHY